MNFDLNTMIGIKAEYETFFSHTAEGYYTIQVYASAISAVRDNSAMSFGNNMQCWVNSACLALTHLSILGFLVNTIG